MTRDRQAGMRLAGALMQILAIPAALLLVVWLVALLGVRCTYGGDCAAGIPLDGGLLAGLYLSVWLPLHLLATGFLAGRVMSRFSTGRNLSSDRSR